jgi:hypothetical protein
VPTERRRRREHQSIEHANVIGLLIGVTGLAMGAFALGRGTSAEGQCCDQLVRRDTELILCEHRLGAGGPLLP